MNKFADFIARNQYSHMIILAVLLLVMWVVLLRLEAVLRMILLRWWVVIKLSK